MRQEATLLSPRPLWRTAAKEAPLRWLGTWAHGLYIGTHNRAFFARYGFSDCRLHFVPYSVDVDFFGSEALRLLPQRASLRARFGLPPASPVVVFVGKLIPKKNPLLLLRAVAQVQQHLDCALLFAGDGLLRPDIEAAAKRLGCRDVQISGFLNQSEISAAYAVADVLVLPSAYDETWGLVVNEALNFRLPIVVSDQVGCAPDLVRHGDNGFVFRNGHTDELAYALTQLLADPDRREQFSEASSTASREWTIHRTAASVVLAAQRAVCRDGTGATTGPLPTQS
jgi:glycosyltransferase involved in cell wall biosynthesis